MSKIRLLILTSSESGTAAHHLPHLLNCDSCTVVMVILSQGQILNRKKYYIRKIRKILRIGVAGALVGVRMRKWYNQDIKKYIEISNLEQLCKTYKVSFVKTPTINCDETFQLFKKAEVDLGISLGNGYIEKRIFSCPVYGMINIHHEILPHYQNAQSVIWQIYNQSFSTGYTIHKINSKIDQGEIIMQGEIPIDFRRTLSDTVARTYTQLLENSAKGLIVVLQDFHVRFNNAKKQGIGKTYTTPTLWQYLKIFYNFRRLKQISKKNPLIEF